MMVLPMDVTEHDAFENENTLMMILHQWNQMIIMAEMFNFAVSFNQDIGLDILVCYNIGMFVQFGDLHSSQDIGVWNNRMGV